MNQNDTILNALKRGPLTAMTAAESYGVWRLAARIKELRDNGHDIRTDMIGNGSTKYARYTLMKIERHGTG